MKTKIATLLAALAVSGSAIAWDGYDWETGTDVEIGQGNLVREGESIEVYDWGTGQYHDVEVDRIESTYRGAEVEVYDYTTGTYRTFEMED